MGMSGRWVKAGVKSFAFSLTFASAKRATQVFAAIETSVSGEGSARERAGAGPSTTNVPTATELLSIELLKMKR
jgi:hypothetical protein